MHQIRRSWPTYDATVDDDSMGPGRDPVARWRSPGGHRSPRLGSDTPDAGSNSQTVRPAVLVGTVVLVLGAVFVALIAFG